MESNTRKDATIRDVAREAGVSVATVSRAMNQAESVSEKLRNRIDAAVAKLDFHPNAIARTLKTNNTGSIGFLVSDISRSFFTTILKGVEDAILPQDYSVMSCSTNGNGDTEQAYLKILLTKKVDGIILNGTGANDAYIAELSRKIPIVLCHREINAPGFFGDFIGCDDFSGIRDLTIHLLKLGHRKIGLINGHLNVSTGRDRYSGFCAAMRSANIEVNSDYEWMVNQGFSAEDGIEGAKRLMEGGNKPTALVCTNDELTLGALKYLYTKQIRIPDDISLVCFGSILHREILYVHPTIATFDLMAIGNKTGEMIIERIRGGNTIGNREVRYTTTIVTGNSTAAPSIR